MEPGGLLERARASAGLTQDELAGRAGASRTTLSAYENGRKSPTVATFARLLAEARYELTAQPQVMFTRQPAARGRWVWVPDHLPRLDVAHAFAQVRLPLHLNWSAPGRVFDLGSRADRARVYEIVLQEGRPADILAHVDGRAARRPLGRPGASAEGPVSVGSGNRYVSRDGGVDAWQGPARWAGMTDLTDFQLEVTRLFFSLPASKGFLLAGGAALLA